MERLNRWSIAWLVLLAVTACSGAPSKLNPRDAALTEYGAALRWNEFDRALAFVDPEVRLSQPMTDLERERLKQIQVTGYEVKSSQPNEDGSISQVVEIRLISKNTQVERVLTDRQAWRWDAASKHFWLTSGLPDFNPE